MSSGEEMWYIAPSKTAYEETMTLDADSLKAVLREAFPDEPGIFYCYESVPGTFVGSVVLLKLEP